MSGTANLALWVLLPLLPLASGTLISYTGLFAPIRQVTSITATVGACDA